MKSSLTYAAISNQAYWPVNLNHISQRISQSIQQGLNLSQKTLYHVLSSFTMSASSIRVWKHIDSTGKETWSAYDREFGRTTSRLSEAEMRVWIEERYRF